MTNKNDYKETLNLPQTDFPMKANLAEREPNILKHWEKINIYKKIRDLCQDRKRRFILHDGPPYANGRPHLGTALNKILKDIIVKSKTLSGYDAPYIPGWDCHGLPIELNVEKKVGKAGEKLNEAEFRQTCRDYAKEQVAVQDEDFQRLGVIGDWQHPYLTMDYVYEANSIRALAKIIANGHVFRGFKPVYWCSHCESALAEAEVEYRNKTSPAIDVGFDLVDLQEWMEVFKVPSLTESPMCVIWTTTPWTLLANQAVSVNSQLTYALVICRLQGRSLQLVVAHDLVEAIMQRYQIVPDDYQILAQANGESMEGLKLKHPFLERIVPIVLGEHVTIEAGGTGCVHTAPGHGIEDYEVGQRYQLPIENPVDSRCCFVSGTPLVAQQHVFKANDIVITELINNGHLLHQESLEHSYPHCWRHKIPLIFRATPQWFVSMDKKGLRNLAFEAIQNVQWLPEWGQVRMGNMLESRSDWCISRQRKWGIPLALFVHKTTQSLHPDLPQLMEEVAKRVEKQGIEAWFALDAKELLGEQSDEYEKVNDVLDVWFDSGVSHACVLEKRAELYEPADLYFEGSDQHRGWFQTSLLTSLAMRHNAPYKKVLTHGYVVDGKGHKMSKSLGNVILPSNVCKTMGADLLRLWAAAQDHRNDISYSDEILRRSADAYRRIRNTARFILGNLYDFDPVQDKVPANELLALDHWAITTTQQLQKEIITAYENFAFPTIYHKLHNFCTVHLGSFYLDILKDRLYTAQTKGLPRRSAQTAMYYIMEALVRWLAPILTFTAEEIWQYMPRLEDSALGQRAESVFLTTWYDDFPEMMDTQPQHQLAYWQSIMQVRDAVNKHLEQCRQNGEIGSALEADVTLYATAEWLEVLLPLADELRFVLLTSAAQALPLSEQDSVGQATELPGLRVAVRPSSQPKCMRCWQRHADVDTDPQYPALCGRCVINISGQGELRYYA